MKILLFVAIIFIGTATATASTFYRCQVEGRTVISNIPCVGQQKMKTREIGFNRYYALFGFGTSARLSAKGDDIYKGPENQTLEENDVRIESNISFFRASMIIGIGVEHSLGGTTALVGGVNFNNGFNSIIDERNSNTRSNYLELTIGVLF